MPVLPATPLLERLANHTGTNPPFAPGTTNATENALKVVCAWPVSGQYGPGSRVLYVPQTLNMLLLLS